MTLRLHLFTVLIDTCIRLYILDQLLAGGRILAFHQSLVLILLHLTLEFPLRGEFPEPLALDRIALAVVVAFGVGVILLVIVLRLSLGESLAER